jgi:hypothetical protein
MGARKKNPNAVALGSKGGMARAKSLSASQLSEIGKKGAKMRLSKLSATERSEIARKAVSARWAKNKRKGEK